MPFKSKSQAKFMFSQRPKIAHRWEKEGKAGWKGLPKHVKMGAIKSCAKH
jgi:hypothetical protein